MEKVYRGRNPSPPPDMIDFDFMSSANRNVVFLKPTRIGGPKDVAPENIFKEALLRYKLVSKKLKEDAEVRFSSQGRSGSYSGDNTDNQCINFGNPEENVSNHMFSKQPVETSEIPVIADNQEREYITQERMSLMSLGEVSEEDIFATALPRDEEDIFATARPRDEEDIFATALPRDDEEDIFATALPKNVEDFLRHCERKPDLTEHRKSSSLRRKRDEQLEDEYRRSKSKSFRSKLLDYSSDDSVSRKRGHYRSEKRSESKDCMSRKKSDRRSSRRHSDYCSDSDDSVRIISRSRKEAVAKSKKVLPSEDSDKEYLHNKKIRSDRKERKRSESPDHSKSRKGEESDKVRSNRKEKRSESPDHSKSRKGEESDKVRSDRKEKKRSESPDHSKSRKGEESDKVRSDRKEKRSESPDHSKSRKGEESDKVRSDRKEKKSESPDHYKLPDTHDQDYYYEGLELNTDVFGGSETFYCKVCQLNLNGVACYETHMNGKKHRKALNAQLLRPEALLYQVIGDRRKDPLFMQALNSNVKMVKSNKRAHLQSTVDMYNDNPLPGLNYIDEIHAQDGTKNYYCELCEAPCLPSSIFPHLLGFKHYMNFLKIIEPSYYERNKDRSKKEIERRVKHLLREHEAKYGKKEITVMRCEVDSRRYPCDDPVPPRCSSRQADIISNPIVTDDYGDFYCKICDAHMNNKNMYHAHMVGKRHLKNEKKYASGFGTGVSSSGKTKAPPNTPSVLEGMLAGIKDTPIVGLNFLRETQVQTGEYYTCFICGCSATADVIDHIVSMKHRIKYLEQVNTNGSIPNSISSIRELEVNTQARESLVQDLCEEIESKHGRGRVEVYI